MNESDPKLLDLQSALAEMRRQREENVRLRGLLREHGIQLPVVQPPNGIPVRASTQSIAHTPVLKAEQRIALFRDPMLARMYTRRLKGYNLIGYTIRDARNETSFFQ